jgi:hypothetical protein
MMCAQCECKRILNTKTKKYHDKDTYFKLVLNKVKITWDSTFIYTHWVPSLRKFFKNFLHVTHVHSYVAHVHPCEN